MTDTKNPAHDRHDGLNDDPTSDRRNAAAPDTFNESQRDEDAQAQTVAEDALAAGNGAETSDEHRDEEE